MNEKIDKYAKGKIELNAPEIILSDTEIAVSVEAGKTYTGTMVVTNNEKKSMKGVIYSSNQKLHMVEEQFVGIENVIHFKADATNLRPEANFTSCIYIVSNCGEREIPVTVTAVAPKIEAGDHEVSSLAQFMELAKIDWGKAVEVFKNDRFESTILLPEDESCRYLYQSLKKGNSSSQALEEFLIALHKKQQVSFSVNKLKYEYENLKESIQDKFVITKDSWGYTMVRITSDAEFIKLDHKILWTDSFVGNQQTVEFEILPENLRKGKNCGHIWIESVHQSICIEVDCNQRQIPSQERINRHKVKECKIKLLQTYLRFRKKECDLPEYIIQSEELTKSILSMTTDEALQLLTIHLELIAGKELDAKEKLEEYEEQLVRLREEYPVAYCGIFYLKALIYKDEATIQYSCEQIRTIYENGNRDYFIIWFLIYLDRKYMDDRKTVLEDVKEQVLSGCHSPILYYEAMTVFELEPALIHNLEVFELQVLNFGIKYGMVTVDIANQFAYLANKERYFNRVVFRCLKELYQKFQNKEILTAICSMLIKGHMRGNQYFEWYRLGVEAQLRVTELHEYYMYSIDEQSEEPLPQPILLYFIYNSSLNDKKRAYLYARIVKDKTSNPSIYRTYLKKIEQFAKRMILSKTINENLAVIYDDLLQQGLITEEMQLPMAHFAFRAKIVCHNPNMKGALIVHKELEPTEFIPFVDGVGQIEYIYEEDFVFLVDQKEQRYAISVDYMIHRYMTKSPALDRILDTTKLRIHRRCDALSKMDAYLTFREADVEACKSIIEQDGIRPIYKNDLCQQLICYYDKIGNYEAMEYYFNLINLEMLDNNRKNSLIEICMKLERFELPLNALNIYGYDEFSLTNLDILAHRCIEVQKDMIPKRGLTCVCEYLFEHGKNDAIIVEYLLQFYSGPTKIMYRIWQFAKKEDLKVHILEEQLLAQVLFTNSDISAKSEVFHHYYSYAPHSNVSQAYLNYLSFLSLYNDVAFNADELSCIYNEAMKTDRLLCLIALLKYESLHCDQIKEEDLGTIQQLLDRAVEQNVLLPSFLNFREKFELPNALYHMTMVEYRTLNAAPVKIKYRILKSDDTGQEYVTEYMTPVILGIYVRSFVLFYNEILEYCFIEENDQERKETEQRQLQYKQLAGNGFSKFDEINDMLLLQSEDRVEELSAKMEEYMKKEYIMNHYFKVL